MSLVLKVNERFHDLTLPHEICWVNENTITVRSDTPFLTFETFLQNMGGVKSWNLSLRCSFGGYFPLIWWVSYRAFPQKPSTKLRENNHQNNALTKRQERSTFPWLLVALKLFKGVSLTLYEASWTFRVISPAEAMCYVLIFKCTMQRADYNWIQGRTFTLQTEDQPLRGCWPDSGHLWQCPTRHISSLGNALRTSPSAVANMVTPREHTPFL